MPRTAVSPSRPRTGGSAREIGPSGGLTLIRGSRGIPTLVQQRRSDALAPALEGIAACDEAIASAGRIRLAIEAGSEMAALNEANRMTVRLTAARDELLRLAGALDGPEPVAA